MSDNCTSTKLLYYFWLPAGKDEFGFKHQELAPLSKTAFYRDHGHVEQTISKRLVEQAGRLRNTQSNLAGLAWTGNPEPTDAALGLQKIQFEFRYERAARSLSFVPGGPLKGNGMLLSNGLYLWSFDLACDSLPSGDELQESCEDFLRNDFIRRYVDTLFTFGWTVSKGGGLDEYDGVMTYYQLDILFNGIFDYNALPHPFFAKGDNRSIEDVYSVANIIKSISLASIQNSHRPLYETHNDFSLYKTHKPEQRINTDADLFETHDFCNGRKGADIPNGREGQAPAEKLLSRLSYAAMEQFLRVAISFGISHYKAGLDYCRAELTDISLLARANQATDDLARPSLSRQEPRLADLESYYSVLAGKVPILHFLQNLVTGLSEASRPLGHDSKAAGSIEGDWTEWKYGESTLREALLQFERQIGAIRSDLQVINQSLNVTRMDQMLSELTETRKLTEIEAETPKEIIVSRSSEDNRELDQRLGRVALLLAIMEVYGNFGVFLSTSFFQGKFFSPDSPLLYRLLGWTHWLIVIVALVIVYVLFVRRYKKKTSPSNGAPGNREIQSYIFDYSGIREKINNPDHAESAIRQLAGSLKALEKPGEPVSCIAVLLSRDTPATMGAERTKYKIESGESERKISYIIHIEIERRWIDNVDSVNEQLRDIRLVVRVPQGEDQDKDLENFNNIIEGSKRLIVRCMKSLILSGYTDGNIREFMRTRFGWKDLPDS